MIKSALILAIAPFIFALSSCNNNPAPRASTSATSPSSARWDAIKSRGKLICGVSGEVPGFSFVGTDGQYTGIDVDVCRAVAAATFNDPNLVEFRNLSPKERFTAVQTGEVDILSRNTTWTLSRDTSVGMEFAPVIFYDGQGVMVTKASGINSLIDLQDQVVCVQSGTTTEQNLADQMRKLGINYKPVVFEDVNIAFAAYAEGRCQAITADRSALVSRRSILPKPEDNQILAETFSSEPLAPAVAQGDSTLANVLKWAVYSLIKAEELGITSENIAQVANTNDPEIKRFLGQEGNLGQGLGLTNDFAARIVQKVGNYGQIYNRHLGPDTKLNLPRGQNQLWTRGGILYAPPFR